MISHPNRQTVRLKSKLLLQTKRIMRQIKLILNLAKPLLGQTKALLRPTPTSCTSVSTIARLINRRESKLGFEYRIFFEEEIALVDRWKNSNVSEFDKLCKQDESGKHTIGADTSGLCMLKAIVQVAKLAGRPDIATQKDIDDFVEKMRNQYGLDLSQGTSWAIFLKFLRDLRGARRDVIFKALVKNNFVPGG
ncbi:hypothetical protein PInf_010112 [Phytophthora infestans]|nr:hypothetical protein PInf_010112 [Phytophthora infestans]